MQILINGSLNQMVMMFGEFILNEDLFFKLFKKKLNQSSFDFEFFQTVRAIVEKRHKINNYIILILILKKKVVPSL